jgi:predicted nucleotidyltransferase
MGANSTTGQANRHSFDKRRSAEPPPILSARGVLPVRPARLRFRPAVPSSPEEYLGHPDVWVDQISSGNFWARGEVDEASDIALIVSLDAETRLLEHAALVRELREFLGCPVGVLHDDGLGPRMQERELKEAIPL